MHVLLTFRNLQENGFQILPFLWQFLGNRLLGKCHVAAIMGYGDLQWGNILITMVYFVEGLGHNMFLVRQFCDSDLEVAFNRNISFVRNLEGVDLLKGNYTTNLYTINLYEMASASPFCLMARATSTKSWLWHQRLSHLNFDTINDLAKNDHIHGLPNIQLFIKTHSLLKDKAPEEIKIFLKKITVFLQAPVIIAEQLLLRATLKTTPSFTVALKKPHTSSLTAGEQKTGFPFFHIFRGLCYPKNDHEDIRKLGAKGDIGFFIGYFANSCAYGVFNRRTKKIMETMNVTFDELSTMAFEQSSSKLGLQGMTYEKISLGLHLTYAPSTITTQKPTERELDLCLELCIDDYIGQWFNRQLLQGNLIPIAPAPQVLQTLTTSTTTTDTALTPTNSSSQATHIPNTSQDVDVLEPQQQHVQQQENKATYNPKIVVDIGRYAMPDGNTFVNPFVPPSTSAAESSSSQYVDPSNMHTFYQPYPHEYLWTKDHPLEHHDQF
ncbi:integrase, catalytic region, zinc finger, CCHC-type containing protein [Tanacetum coccineum]|uniref:Integrase, catalytic region, zinc finger, CCHC-type containing protein n=1 Tax=Tanacetum coccineum TaxID=301880 RepID=A0ABQ5CZ72_9ASTR